MNRRNLFRRSGRLLAMITVTVTAVAHYGASGAVAKPGSPPLALIGSDGSVVDAASLLAPSRADLAGSPGTGLTGGDIPDPLLAGTLVSDTGDGPGIMKVIGADDRQRTSPTTGSVMSRSTVQITYTTADGTTRQGCTGWMFGPDTVITAGHCVYDPGVGWEERTIRVFPGRDGYVPHYGYCTVRTMYTVTGWAYEGIRKHDFGALKLNCDVGNNTGWMGVWWTTASLVDTYVFIRGYPCDQRYGTQWWDGGNVTRATSFRLFYQIDTYDCQSGSPVYNHVTGDNCTCVLAIHTTGTSSENGSTRINQSVGEWLFYWRNL